MLAKERRDDILKYLENENKVIRISEIVKRYDVSTETARRDLEALQEEGLVTRVHGGAKLIDKPNGINSVEMRENVSDEVKKSIGELASTLVKDGDRLFLGIGSTILEFAKTLKNFRGLTVLTISIPVILELANTDVTLIALGGQIDGNEYCMYGNATENTMRNLFVDKSFLGCGGVTIKHGVTNHVPFSVGSSAMYENAKELILLADSTKFGEDALSFVCPIDRLDRVVTDSGISDEYKDSLKKAGVEVLIAE